VRARRRVACAFTLVELLVVVAVVALLVAILLPSLAGARGAGQLSACASNLRQLTIADDLYAGDHGEHYAPGAADLLSNLDRWHGTRGTPSQPFSPEGGPLTPYIGGGDGPREPGPGSPGVRRLGVRMCPTFAPAVAALDAAPADAGFERACGGYGYNSTFVGTDRARVHSGSDDPDLWEVRTDLVGADRGRFFAPAKTVAFADAALAVVSAHGAVAIEYSFIEPRFWPDRTPGDDARPDPSVHFRHARPRSGAGGGAGVANIARLDGHVATAAMAFTWSSGMYGADPRELGIGWPGDGDADDNAMFDYD
jgi:prepilin-type N-terminal cleavage/methylation domain-containing protein/prepilin-type processing-associated H-X9-DG protein